MSSKCNSLLLILIGVIIAIGRIVLRVFNEKNAENDESHHGV